MTKSELLERLRDIPDDAKVFLYADYAQTPFVVFDTTVIDEDVSGIEFSGEELDWDNPDRLTEGKPITAVMLL